jgi:hypothetical protein
MVPKMTHGHYVTAIKHKCPCRPCKDARNAYMRSYRRRTARNGHQLVSATACRRHLKILRSEGFPYQVIGDCCGMNGNNVWRIGSGKTRKVTRAVEDAITGVTITDCLKTSKGYRPFKASKKLLNEFIEAGFTNNEVRKMMGGYNVLKVSPEYVLPKTANRVQEIHDAVWREDERFRQVCNCYAPTDLDARRAVDAEKQRQHRARKALSA